MKKDDLIGGAMLLGILLIIGAFFVFAPEGKELSYGPVEVAGSAILATAPSDGEVDVTAMIVKPGFITVHKSIGGAPGPVIGSSGYLDVGANQQVTMMTTELMDPATPYVALLHVDNGDRRFVAVEDMPVTSNGASVRADFTSP